MPAELPDGTSRGEAVSPLLYRRARAIAELFSWYALVGGAVSFLGWVLDLPVLADWERDEIAIQPNATVAAMAAGLASLRLLRGDRVVPAVLGVITALLGSTALLQYVTRIDLNIDTVLMFGRTWGRQGVLFPGRMGPLGAVCWTLIGAALVVMATIRGPGAAKLAQALTAASLSLAGLSLIGYLYGADVLFAIPTMTVIALQTATFVAAMSASLLLGAADHAPAATLLDDGPAGTLTRRILPAVVLVPVLLGLLHLLGAEAGVLSMPFGTALRTFAEMAMLVVLLLWTAATIRAQSAARFRAEAEAAAGERRLVNTLETLGEAFVTIDRDWRYSYVNAEAERVLARPRGELLGQKLWDVLPAAARGLAWRELHRVLQSHEAVEFDDFDPVLQKWFSNRAYPAPGGGVALYFQDVTQRRTAEAALQQATRRQRQLIDANIIGVMMMADDGRLLESNDAFLDMVGYTRGDPLTWQDLALSGSLRLGGPDQHSGPFGDGGPHEAEFTRKDGTRVPVLVGGTFVEGTQGEVLCFVVDITERKHMELALEDANRRKDEFLATLAHELRNPLAPARNALEVMKAPSADAATIEKARLTLERQLLQMVRLIDDLLDLGRISQNKLRLHTERVDLSQCINDAEELVRPLLKARNQRLEIAASGAPIVLNADKVRLTQVFGNLLANASKFSDENGRIAVTLTRAGDDAVISVRDEGVGIPHHMLESVFDMFTQVDQSLEKSQGGLGIGLTLVKQLVEMHDGNVVARSDGPGRGSEFVVTLPISLSEGEAPRGGTHRRSTAPVGEPKRILIVDDNLDAAETLAILLSFAGHQTVLAHDGERAVATAERERPDVILMDIGLPGMNGYDACRAIRAEYWGKPMLIFALSGWGQERDRVRSMQSGFDGHLVKPVEPTTLMQTIQGIGLRESPSRDPFSVE